MTIQAQCRPIGPLLALLLLFPGNGAARPPSSRSEPIDLKRAGETLMKGDADDARATLLAIRRAPSPASAELVSSALLGGLPESLVAPALTTLAHISGPHATDVLLLFAGHRRVGVRTAALSALVKLKPPGLVGHLQAGLSDSDPRVRGLCARALGSIGAHQATNLLLVALARGVPEAARAIGQLGDGAVAIRYGELLGRVQLDVMLSGYAAFLARPELAEQDKVAIVTRLEGIASLPVKRFLQTRLLTTDSRSEPALKQAIAAAVSRIADGPSPKTAPSGARVPTTKSNRTPKGSGERP